MRFLTRAACVGGLMLCALAAAAQPPDYWQVRSHGHGAQRSVESISVLHAPGSATPVPETRPYMRRENNVATLELRADAASVSQLPGVPEIGPDIEQALLWMQRLTTAERPRARIALHLVELTGPTRFRVRHPASNETVIELMMPLVSDPGSDVTAQLGAALATALHELAHASAAGSGLARSEDEYRASLVAACYRIDTLRPGDTLHVRAAFDPLPAGESFVGRYSRDAAQRVMEDLAKAAGTREIAWYDRTAMLGVQLFCGSRLAGRA